MIWMRRVRVGTPGGLEGQCSASRLQLFSSWLTIIINNYKPTRL